ncbi:hypothetical protein KY290_005073 [Solanum tuberosum]|uniref:Transposase-associated domain-containing protein n=1 Tax=Solanum tuberosum TaxID=4113 RepID=A0ABQ7WD24_SOLTU|nr:hypothetical protein KY289_005438 [Solanum tuberosum]KAH0778646.1 hypothetical protein KY290_005073 [Solanum tuberosum]
MAPNKEWMQLVQDRLDNAYIIGVEKFLDYSFTKLGETQEIRCPCIRCCNASSKTHEIVRSHLLVYGIIQSYTFRYHHGERLGEPYGIIQSYNFWYHHGERLGEPESDSEFVEDNNIENDDDEDEMHELLRDLHPDFTEENMNINSDDFVEAEPNPEAKRFYSLLNDYEQPLYEGSKERKLFTLIKLLHIKSIGQWSNVSFTMLLKMLKEDLLPDGSNLPDSYYEAKKCVTHLDGRRINAMGKHNLNVVKKYHA